MRLHRLRLMRHLHSLTRRNQWSHLWMTRRRRRRLNRQRHRQMWLM
jgi:hypothetical protein